MFQYPRTSGHHNPHREDHLAKDYLGWAHRTVCVHFEWTAVAVNWVCSKMLHWSAVEVHYRRTLRCVRPTKHRSIVKRDRLRFHLRCVWSMLMKVVDVGSIRAYQSSPYRSQSSVLLVLLDHRSRWRTDTCVWSPAHPIAIHRRATECSRWTRVTVLVEIDYFPLHVSYRIGNWAQRNRCTSVECEQYLHIFVIACFNSQININTRHLFVHFDGDIDFPS